MREHDSHAKDLWSPGANSSFNRRAKKPDKVDHCSYAKQYLFSKRSHCRLSLLFYMVKTFCLTLAISLVKIIKK